MRVLAILFLSLSLALASESKSERESFPINDKPSEREVIGLGN